MSMKKGYCLKCKTSDEKRRVFDVNSEASICYCPTCMSAHKPEEVIRNFNELLNDKITQAFYQLNVLRRPRKAYAIFANVLEFDSDNVVALSGRISALIYLSTLRKTYFKDVISLLNISKHRFHLIGSKETYSKLLSNLNSIVEEYHHNLAKRLTNRGYFYDSECLKLFILRLQEIKEFKEILQREFIFLERDDIAVSITKELAIIDKAIHADLYTADGIKREFISFNELGVPTFKALDAGKIKPLPRYRMATLNLEQKGMRKIQDIMFVRNKRNQRFIVSCLSIGGISVLGSVAFFIGAGIASDIILKNLFIGLGIGLIACAGIFIGLFILIKKNIKKKIKKKHLSV